MRNKDQTRSPAQDYLHTTITQDYLYSNNETDLENKDLENMKRVPEVLLIFTKKS